jgi:hypothetical protein
MTSRKSRIAREGRIRALRSIFTAFAALLSVLMLATPANAATRCDVTATPMASSQLKVVQLSVQGVGCAKATTVARQVGVDLAAGKPLTLSGVSGIDIASTAPCANCATKTQVAITYPKGSIDVSLAGKTKVASPAASGALPAVPFPQIPPTTLPRIPGFTFPSIPGFPNPDSSNSGAVTV